MNTPHALAYCIHSGEELVPALSWACILAVTLVDEAVPDSGVGQAGVDPASPSVAPMSSLLPHDS